MERTARGLLDELVDGVVFPDMGMLLPTEELVARCNAAEVSYEVARESARIAGVLLSEIVREREDWWPWLKERSDQLLTEWQQQWLAKVDDGFCQVVDEGGGPVDALSLGYDGVRSLVRPDLLTRVDRWSPTEGGLLISGETESGKTMAALALAWRFVREHNQATPSYSRTLDVDPNIPVVWTQGAHLGIIRESWRAGEERPSFELRCEEAPLLVLDDLLYAEHRCDVILQIAARRMNRGIPTITTTGWSENRLVQKLGTSGLRRLTRCGSGAGHIYVVGGSSVDGGS